MRIVGNVVFLVSFLMLVGCTTETSPLPARPQPTAPAASTGESAAPVVAEAAVAVPEGSKISFVGTKSKGRHDGGFKQFTVTINPIQADLSASKINVDIDVDSMWTDTGKLTNHLKSPAFFEVKKYPKASFVSTAIKPNKSADATHTITGDLTMHGQTKQISFPAKITITDDAVAIDGEFKINRHDFGISYGKGQVHDDVTLKVAVRVPRK